MSPLEHHRRNDIEDRYWRERRRVTIFLIAWFTFWLTAAVAAWVVL